ncbi:glycosyltransferase family 2 protein [Brumimicrobium mesophilum]|uniref:glycosyltransferase family 2 protein n=1 Tax=Brumimicrobium mesophilum TaxID=392717 RepID=UPI000D144386|nr:glycosyltransferase family 2 protein [Brumimicrobium mesophilum]
MKTAVVILNWNGLTFLKQFLPILIQNTSDATIVVVDNQSTDESLTYVRNNHPEVQVILNDSNGGFAKGYNDGLTRLKGRFEYYVLINSDIEVTPNWLNPLIDKLDQNPKIAGVQPKVLAFHRRSHFEHAGASGGFIDKNYYPFCRGRIFDEVEEDIGQYNNDKEVFWTTGACMAVRSEIYHRLGGLDEDFFAHMEEIDFCWRAKKQNHSFYVVPTSKVYHVGGGTLNYENPRKTFLNFRNSLYTIHKNHVGWLFGKVIYRLILDGVAAVKYLVGFQFKHIIAILKAHGAYYSNIPTLNKKRKQIKLESTEYNKGGLYKASLLWAYFFKRIKKFEGLNKRFFIK